MFDTIAAVATAYGEGGIGIIRISGEAAEAILRRVFVCAKEPVDRMLTYGMVTDPDSGEVIDEAMAVLMKAPATYTREDVAEIDCHGSVVALQRTLALVLRCGARLAEPGEFTKRAFLNGRLDLTQAEAVIDLVRAKTETGFDAALSQLSGMLSAAVADIRRELVDILVELTVNIDYPDEDIEVLTYDRMNLSLETVHNAVNRLLASFARGRIIREGIRVAIIGKPNVGKSSLMNALLQESRAIVTEIPGTTRDTIEEVLNLGGIPVLLTDTAGIRHTEDAVEKIGIARSRAAADRADLVLFMTEACGPLTSEDREIAALAAGHKVLAVLNKCDLGRQLGEAQLAELFPEAPVLYMAAGKGEGVDALASRITELVLGGKAVQSTSMLVTNARHADLLEKAAAALEDAMALTKRGEPLDLVEIDVNHAYCLLGEMIGETVSDDILQEVFSRFCLGK